MKSLLIQFLTAGATRRLLVLALLPLGAWADRKLGIQLSVESIAAVTIASVVHIIQSAWKEKGIEAAKLDALARVAATAADPKAAISALLDAAGSK